jgi:hypothetical protein
MLHGHLRLPFVQAFRAMALTSAMSCTIFYFRHDNITVLHAMVKQRHQGIFKSHFI